MNTRQSVRLAAVLLSVAWVAAACESADLIIVDREHHAAEGVGSIELFSPAVSLEVGSTVQLSAEVSCRHGLPMEDVELQWISATPERMDVSAEGVATALRSGVAVIEARAADVHGDLVLRLDPFTRPVGIEGGQLSYRDGLVSVLVGPGALSEGASLSIEEADDVPEGGPGSSLLIPRTAYRFGPDGFRFEEPVEIRFRYDASALEPGTDEQRLRVHRLAGDAWLPLEHSEVSPGTATVSAWTSSFSVYSVLDYRPAAASVVLTPWESAMAVGENLQLDVAVLGASGQPIIAPVVEWRSSDPRVARVGPAGEVTALQPGTVTITASSSGSVGEATVAVFGPLASIALDPLELWLTAGRTGRLHAVLLDDFGVPVGQLVTWSSADDGVAVMSTGGEVRAVAPGTVTIVASSGGQSASASVHVTAPPVSIVISPRGGYHAVGDTITFAAAVLDALGNDLGRPVTWDASDPTVLVGPGRVRALRAGTVLLTASVDEVSTLEVLTFLDAADLPDAMELDPSPILVATGESVQVAATVTDRLGNVLPQAAVTWMSGNPAVATVDVSGLVSGLEQGTTLLLARSGHANGFAEIVVGPPRTGNPHTIEVWPLNPELTVGGTARITAVVYDTAGMTISDAQVTWSSSDASVVSVDATGLIAGAASGTATIVAASGPLSGSTTVTVVEHGSGGHEEGLGNNLSWPVVFAEGYGLTGLFVATDAGLRPTADEGIAVTEIPFFPSTNAADYFLNGVDYYTQRSANVWQAEWIDGSGGLRGAEVTWGDNLTHHTFTTHSQIRVETTLSSLADAPLVGYNMTHLYGERSTEMQGTDGTTNTFVPSLFTVAARLKIEKLDNTTFEPVFTLFDRTVADGLASEGPGTFGVEVNVAGKLIYGYNLRVQDAPIPLGVDKYGWWRLTFSLDDQAGVGGTAVDRGVSLERCGKAPDDEDEPLTYTPALDVAAQQTVLDIWIASAKGSSSHGGGGSGGHTTDGGCGDH